ncbi:MAG: hypothetical protein CML02_03590 [Pseudooceanicola sp.]|jgi:hypothetical protein|nr:hypothetical protein [Pseudooceanicola sp.]
MKLTLTTALATALIATGAYAETASRGADNVTSEEKVEMNTPVDADANAELQASSRGNADIQSEEATDSPLIKSDEVAGTDLSNESSRGAGNLTSEEIAKGETGADVTVNGVAPADMGATMSASNAASNDIDNASRGNANDSSEEVTASNDGSVVINDEEAEAMEASRGEDNATSEEVADEAPGTRLNAPTSGSETASRGADNETGSEVQGIDNQTESGS